MFDINFFAMHADKSLFNGLKTSHNIITKAYGVNWTFIKVFFNYLPP